ncbi:MAG: hypothetical protein R6V19_10920 [Armatimonadota bacterium]
MCRGKLRSRIGFELAVVVVVLTVFGASTFAAWQAQMGFDEYCQECVRAEIEGLTPAQPVGGDEVTIEFRITFDPQQNQGCPQEMMDSEGDTDPGPRVVVQWSTETGHIGQPHILSHLQLQPGETSDLLSDTITAPQTFNRLEVEIGLETNTMQPYKTVQGGLLRYTSGAPHFEQWGVTPHSGNETTEFCFRAQYASEDNTGPSAVKVEIAGQQHEMQKENANDSDYTDGCWYEYTTTLPIQEYESRYLAYDGGEVVAQTDPRPHPRVSDTTPPVIVEADQQQPPVTVNLENEISLSGTATDNHAGVTKVEWSTDAENWHPAQGTEQWSFTVNSDTPDQQVREDTIYVRAKDGAGNMTPGEGWLKQKVKFDNRHPHILDVFVTESSLLGLDAHDPGWHDDKPLDRGGPTMGNTYLVCFKIENPSNREWQIRLNWEERTSPSYDEPDSTQFVDWDVDMDGDKTWGPEMVNIAPLNTQWYYTKWEHRWQWIPDQGWVDFLADMVISFIPVATETLDYIQFCTWADTIKCAVVEAETDVYPGQLSPNMLPPEPDEVPITIKVSIPKRLALYSSVSCGVGAFVSTNLGYCTTAMPWVAAGFFIAEAACIVSSHAYYQAAEDPTPNYRQRAELRHVTCPELDELRGKDGYEMAKDSVALAENSIAFRDSFIRYRGAVHAGDAEWAKKHATDAAKFADDAAGYAKKLDRHMQQPLREFQNLSDEQRREIMKLSKQGLPEIERDVLMNTFGMNRKDIEVWSQRQPEITKTILENPEAGQHIFQQLAKSLETLSREMKDRTR